MNVPLSQIHPGQRLRVINHTRDGRVLVQRLHLALRYGSRLRGLLWRQPLGPGEGMLLMPCNGVHTFFMGYPIDVLFLNEGGDVHELVPGLAPWRLTSIYGQAVATLELAAGGAARAETVAGDRLVFEQY